jgi:ATP-binding cassette, sub-family E, member 1
LDHLLDRDIRVLSGGELQRFAIAAVAVQTSDVYMFDEPSSYLDVKQRLTAAAMIRQILEMSEGDRRYVLVVEHDLAVLDYLSDYVCVLYGSPGGYGVVTMPHSVRIGINAFLAGFISSENMRFRDHALSFKVCVFSTCSERTRLELLTLLSRFRNGQKQAMKARKI